MQAPSLRRRRLAASLAALAALATAPQALRAQDSPVRPVKLLLGAPPGGPTDFLARMLADALSARPGQGVVVDYKPGAAGTLAAEAVAQAAPDGFTLLVAGPSSTVAAPLFFRTLRYDPARDFTPVAMLGAGAFVLVVHPSLPARTVAEFLALARSREGGLRFGSSGIGSAGHLCAELIGQATGARLLHVPYKGEAQAANDLLGGQIDFMITAPNMALPHARAGRLRILAVTTRERTAALPEVPTLHEAGLPGFEYLGWLAVFAPTGTPRATVEAVQAAWARTLAEGPVPTRLGELGMRAPQRLESPAGLAAFLASEQARLARVVKETGLKAE
ncbi:MAG: tripartite tricarboxylate transporter substrate binding protein [Burkholderiales bacterium]|nr:tripartite tricarboxylate transporter substrate binding protein [Burkholderiales bacterium]